MGQVNQPSNLLDRIKRLEQQYQQLWKAIGLTSATIEKGGLTLLNDAYIRMVDDNGDEIVYIGPDGSGRQIIRIRREGGGEVLYTYTLANGNQFWALTDTASNILVSDDALSGLGIARPWIPLPHKPIDWNVLPKTTSTAFTTLDEIRFYKQQPRVVMALRIGATVGSTGEWRVLQDNAMKASGTIGPALDVAFTDFTVAGSHMAPLSIDVQARVTSGPGPVSACIREATGAQS
jgi:hypothetical protein